jgi:hypothetical protein
MRLRVADFIGSGTLRVGWIVCGTASKARLRDLALVPKAYDANCVFMIMAQDANARRIERQVATECRRGIDPPRG